MEKKKKILLLGSKTTQIMWPHHRTCLQAGAHAMKYGYFLFISILPSNLLSHWHFFFPQQAGNQERILRFSACFQSNSYLSKGPESQTEVLTLTPPVLLRAPGPALTRLLGKWRRKCPLLHPSWFSADSTHWPSGLSSLLCTQLGLGSGNFLQDSALFFFFFSHFCKPGCVKRGEHWPGWDIMLLVHI